MVATPLTSCHRNKSQILNCRMNEIWHSSVMLLIDIASLVISIETGNYYSKKVEKWYL